MKNQSQPTRETHKNKTVQELDILPLENTVLFPGHTIPLPSLSELTPKQLKEVQSHEISVGVLLCDDKGWAETGTFAQLTGLIKTPEGGLGGLFRGEEKFKVLSIREHSDGRWTAKVQPIQERQPRRTQKLVGMTKALKNLILKLLSLTPNWNQESLALVGVVDDPHALSYLVAPLLSLNPREKQSILEMEDATNKVRILIESTTQELELLKASNQVEEEAKNNLNQNIRRSWLNEKLQAIKKEIDEIDGVEDEIEQLEKSFKDLNIDEKSMSSILKELKRLDMMPQGSSEAAVALSHLQLLAELPWNEDHSFSELEPSKTLKIAHKVLNNEHSGLEKVKDRVIEQLAITLHNKKVPGRVLLLVGPPGVGKTSLAESIANALSRPFCRVSLGGVKDEAEIRGHRKTYIGAMPGKIIQGIKQAGSRSCVMLLDEIDKVGREHGQDLSAALLEVLDPNQNQKFADHYLGVPFDLSSIFFVATANSLETIPAPLRDRMEILELSGYTESEKVAISQNHLIPKISKKLNLDRRRFRFQDETLRHIIQFYTKEAGVRQLSRELESLGRKMVKRTLEGKKHEKFSPTFITKELGPVKYLNEPTYKSLPVGVTQGLAYTSIGGDILYIESNMTPVSEGRGRLLLTGSLGKVMQESVQTALTFLHSRSEELGIDPKIFEKHDIHVHFPDGATPKDGPSAGIAIATGQGGIRIFNGVFHVGILAGIANPRSGQGQGALDFHFGARHVAHVGQSLFD